jgi:hypothetical protein
MDRLDRNDKQIFQVLSRTSDDVRLKYLAAHLLKPIA